MRIVRCGKQGQMAVPLRLVLRHKAAEMTSEGAVVPLHMPVRLRVVRRGMVLSCTE